MTVGLYAVIIPAYAAAGFIGETIASVLAQSIPPDRIIVVDDGSPDDTAAVVRAIDGPIECIRQANTGPGRATMRGLSRVDTEFVATLDHDDLWLPHKIERQLARMRAAPGLAAVFGRVAQFSGDPAGADLDNSHEGWTRATMFMRSAVAKSIAPLVDYPSKLGDMIDWLARFREARHRLEMIPEVLALRRIRPGSLSARSRQELALGYLPVVRDALRRRRSMGERPRGYLP
jgi:glycosyltransferase involved in cell wall biosynthesis